MTIVTNKKYSNIVSYWLILLITLIVLMIIVGGLTRLTDSGLSITEWELFSGILPPLTDQSWQYNFNLYKETTQYKIVNFNMTIDEFKIIYLWEYYHRLLGRIIGLTFLIPFLFFSLKKYFNKEYLIRLSLVFSLILFQGFMGWYMVQSGLTEKVSVSHYRLSIHLLIAFLILSILFWILLNHINSEKDFFKKTNKFTIIKYFILILYLQIIFGAFVSGLDAGKIYQTWPLMNNSFIPNDLIFSKLSELIDFSNHSLVQFIHRNIAYLIFLMIVYIGYQILKTKNKDLIKSYLYVLFFVLVQIFLGIYVLLSNLNISVASLHQISSIFLVIFSLRLYHKSINRII